MLSRVGRTSAISSGRLIKPFSPLFTAPRPRVVILSHPVTRITSVQHLSTAATPPKPSRLKKAGKFFGWLLVIIGTVVALFQVFLNNYQSDYSLAYFGKTKAEEAQICADMGFPGAPDLQPHVMKIASYLNLMPEADPCPVIDEFMIAHPRCFLGPLFKAYYFHFIKHDSAAAQQAFQDAHKLVAANPNEYVPLHQFLPPTLNEMYPPGSVWEPRWNELVPNKVWICFAPNKVNCNNSFPNNSTIVKRKDGSVLIINPTSFPPEAVEKINAIGPVSAILTTTIGHGVGVRKAHEIWPQAQCLGTDAMGKHDEGQLPWKFLTQDSDYFKGEFELHQIRGHGMRELLLYDAETKGLYGLTDFCLPTEHTTPYPLPGSMYFFALGGWVPNPDNSLTIMSYHYLMTLNRKELRKSLDELLALDVEFFTHGHSDHVWRGEQGRAELTKAFSLVTPSEQLSFLDRLYLPWAWLKRSGLVSLIFEKMGSQLKK